MILIPPYAYQVYAGTPIGALLEAEPTPGRAALAGLHKIFLLGSFWNSGV